MPVVAARRSGLDAEAASDQQSGCAEIEGRMLRWAGRRRRTPGQRIGGGEPVEMGKPEVCCGGGAVIRWPLTRPGLGSRWTLGAAGAGTRRDGLAGPDDPEWTRTPPRLRHSDIMTRRGRGRCLAAAAGRSSRTAATLRQAAGRRSTGRDETTQDHQKSDRCEPLSGTGRGHRSA